MSREQALLVRFDIRRELSGWTVIDRITGKLAVIDGRAAESLEEEEAAEDCRSPEHVELPEARFASPLSERPRSGLPL